MERKTTYTRDELLALTPGQYLAGGFRDGSRKARPELRGVYATAASLQLEARGVPPMEMRITYEAWKQAVDDCTGPPREVGRASLAEALETARAILQQPNSVALVDWLLECVEQVKDEQDLPLLLDHFLSATKQSGVLLALSGSD